MISGDSYTAGSHSDEASSKLIVGCSSGVNAAKMGHSVVSFLKDDEDEGFAMLFDEPELMEGDEGVGRPETMCSFPVGLVDRLIRISSLRSSSSSPSSPSSSLLSRLLLCSRSRVARLEEECLSPSVGFAL